MSLWRSSAFVLIATAAVGCRADEAGPVSYPDFSLDEFTSRTTSLVSGSTVTFSIKGGGLAYGKIEQSGVTVYQWVNARKNGITGKFISLDATLPTVTAYGAQGETASLIATATGVVTGPDAGVDPSCEANGTWTGSLPLVNEIGPGTECVFPGPTPIDFEMTVSGGSATFKGRSGTAARKAGSVCEWRMSFMNPEERADILISGRRGRASFVSVLGPAPSGGQCRVVYGGDVNR